MRIILLALLLVSSGVFAAAPTISSASITGGVLTVAGANFDSKATAAPFFYQDFTTNNGTADGDLLVGYADQRAYAGALTGSIKVDTSLGRTAGRGALKITMDAGASDYFPHMGLDTSNTGLGTLKSKNSDVLYTSFWMKTELESGSAGSGLIQVKALRAGSINTVGDNYYSTGLPMYVTHIYPYADSSNTTLYQESRRTDGSSAVAHYGGDTGTWTSDSEHFIGVPTTSSAAWDTGGWNFIEELMVMNTPGVADGTLKTYVNGVLQKSDMDTWNTTTVNSRDTGESSKHFDFLLFMTGMDMGGNSGDGKYRVLVSEHYVDTTRQKVMLGNASTLAAATGGLLAVPSAWTDTLGVGAITAAAANIPSGYNYVYVTNAAGETNSTGFAYSSGGGGDATATATGVTLTATAGTASATGSASASATGATATLAAFNASATGDIPTSVYPFVRSVHQPITRNIHRSIGR